MRLFSLASRAIAALFVPVTAFAFQSAPVQPTQVGTTGVVTVVPPVPGAAGAPCVVNLLQDAGLGESDLNGPEYGTAYTYAPPAGCHGPWAKVVLKVNVTEIDGVDPTAGAYIRLGGIQIFASSLTSLLSATNQSFHPSWQAERDVTDLASLLTQAHNGVAGLRPEQNLFYNELTEEATMSASLLFYRASAATPAQKTADAVYRVSPDSNTVTLPHNIVRAYLDVYNDEPWWFTCVTQREDHSDRLFFSALALGGGNYQGIGPSSEGCTGGSFAEIGVSIDGTPAGIAPVFPLLSSKFSFYFTNTVNAPIQPPQMLSHVPYRVDLTPFAAILNEAGEHTIALSRPATGYLLVYLDKGSTRVSGAVTLNTLAGSPGTPTVTDAITIGSDSATGNITTSLDRTFDIQGFVNTSRGRVNSSVHQTSHFQNTQVFHNTGQDGVEGQPLHYQQDLTLASTTSQHSHRTRAGVVLNDEVRNASYPLQLNFAMDGYAYDSGDGPITYASGGSASVEQHRNLDATYQKGGFGFYNSQVREDFLSSRDFDSSGSSNWQAQAHYRFNDNQGSCYQSALTALNGAVATEAKGVGCPNGQNHVRWYAHPDGSPDSLGWAH